MYTHTHVTCVCCVYVCAHMNEQKTSRPSTDAVSTPPTEAHGTLPAHAAHGTMPSTATQALPRPGGMVKPRLSWPGCLPFGNRTWQWKIPELNGGLNRKIT